MNRLIEATIPMINFSEYDAILLNEKPSKITDAIKKLLKELNPNLDATDKNLLYTMNQFAMRNGTFYPNKNPFMSYLYTVTEYDITPSKNDIKMLQNKYDERIITDDDLKQNNNTGKLFNKLLGNKEFYAISRPEEKEFLLDMYSFFSKDENINRVIRALSRTDKQRLLKTTAETKDKIRDAIIFNKDGSIKTASEIEELVQKISDKEQKKGTAPKKTETSTRKRTYYSQKWEDRVSELKKTMRDEDEFIDFVSYIKANY